MSVIRTRSASEESARTNFERLCGDLADLIDTALAQTESFGEVGCTVNIPSHFTNRVVKKVRDDLHGTGWQTDYDPSSSILTVV